MTGVSVACPAKLNLFLRILAREETGYHQIETLFQAVGLFDHMKVRRHPRQGIFLEIRRSETAPGTGDIIGDLGDPERNTVARAARAFFAVTGVTPAVSLILNKTIPAGTGMGGGSSDAAGTLVALNLLHGRPLGNADLIELGGRIGSDVPFFCARIPTALAWGRGDRLLACPPPPAAYAVLVIPRDRVSTAAAYREASSRLGLPAAARLLDGLDSRDWRALGAGHPNDFEPSVFAWFHRLREVLDALVRHGAVPARLAGSGSAVFGIFGEERKAVRAAREIRGGAGVAAALVAPTLTVVPEPAPITDCAKRTP